MASGTKPAVQVRVDAKTEDAQKSIKKFEKAMTRSFGKVELASIGIGLAINALGATFRRLKAHMGETIKAAAEQERVELALLTAIRSRQRFSQADFERLQAHNNERQQSLGIGDEEQLQLQAQASALGIHATALNKTTKRVIALRDMTGGSSGLGESLKKVAKIINGSTTELQELGIKTKTAEEALAKLDAHFLVVEQRSGTFAQKLDTLNANYGDLMETMGFLVTKNKALKIAFEGVNKGVLKVKEIFEDDKFQKKMSGWIAILARLGQAATLVATGFYAMATLSTEGIEIEALYELKRTLKDIEKSAAAVTATVVTPIGTPQERERMGGGRRILGAGEADPNQKLRGRLAAKVKPPPTGGSGVDKEELRRRARERRALEDEIWARSYEKNKAARKSREAEEAREEQERLQRYKEGQQFWADYNMEAELERDTAKQESDKYRLEQEREFWATSVDIAVQGSTMVAQAIGVGIASGEMEMGRVLANMGAMVLGTFGDLFIALGTAAIVGGKASTAAAFLAPYFGGPAGVVAGISMIGAGVVMKGAAAGVSHLANAPKKDAQAARSTVAGMRRREDRTKSRRDLPGSGSGNVVVNVNFNQPVGSPRRAAMMISDILKTGGTLTPAWNGHG